MKLRTLEYIYHLRRVGKRTLSLLLAVVMMFSLAAPALSMTIAVVNTESAFSSGELFDGDGSYSVRVNYDESAQLPEDVRLVTSEVVDMEAYLAAAEAELAVGQKTVFSRFFEISLIDAEGNPIQPAAPVGVVIKTSDAPEDAQAMVFHYPTVLSAADDAVSVDEQAYTDEQAEDGDAALAKSELANAELEGLRLESSLMKRNGLMANRELLALDDAGTVVDAPVVEGTALPIAESVEIEDSVAGTIAFMADGFSVYGVVWTIDFNYEVDGKEFEYSVVGGSGIGFSELLPMIGVIEDNPETTEDEVWDFIEQIESVEFSNPELVWVGKAEAAGTFGELIADWMLPVEYSADLSEEDIIVLHEKAVRAGDWALISIQPFTTEETLTVTMADGQVWDIYVYDAQIIDQVAQLEEGYYYIYTASRDGGGRDDPNYNCVMDFAGGRQVINDMDNPNLSDSYKWHFTKNPNGTWIIQNVGNSAKYLALTNTELISEEPVEITINLRDTDKLGFKITNIETSKVLSYTPDEHKFDLTDSTNTGARIRLLGTTAPTNTTEPTQPDTPTTPSTTSSGLKLDDPVADKTLTPNKYTKDGKEIEDGTYTLTLSVKGSAKSEEEDVVKKSNILFIMDRSSSMYDHRVNEYTGGNDNRRRIEAEQDALNGIISQLMAKNNNNYGKNGSAVNDLIESSVISFATMKGKDQKRTYDNRVWEGTEIGWQSGTSTTALMNAVNDPDLARGTNWEEALIYAKEVMDAKKAIDGDEENYYVVFLTDGGPTATSWSITTTEGSGQYGAYYGTSGHSETDLDSRYADRRRPRNSCEPAYEDAADDARALVQAGYIFYPIFTYGSTGATGDYQYLIRLTNYAYGESEYIYDDIHDDDPPTDYFPDSVAVNRYFTNATSTEKLVNAFNDILSHISESIAYSRVKITDGLTTDAMTTTLVQGEASGFKYVVKDGNMVKYSVTASGNNNNPSVTFTINGQTYTGVEGSFMDNVKDPLTGVVTQVSRVYYYPTGFEGNSDDYRMTLASVDAGGQVTWDLSGVGTLKNGYTYEVSFVVWPDQNAYDYVAGLNNGLNGYTWDSSVENDTHKVEIKDINGVVVDWYWYGGVSQYPSIVKYRNGTYSVKTNTDQELTYSIVETKVVDGTPTTEYYGPYTETLPTPKPMDLLKTESRLQKEWKVDLDPSVYYALLYGNKNGPITMGFEIYQDVQNAAHLYHTINLGWDPTANGGQGGYVWEEDDEDLDPISYGESSYQVGRTWGKNFYIASGLMLSEHEMDRLGLDKSIYPDCIYTPEGASTGTTYYILEPGHDYIIVEKIGEEEDSKLGYEFDFQSPVYHPMLVDGVLKSVDVKYTYDETMVDGKQEINTVVISGISSGDLDLPSIKVTNELRGYIHVNKVVVDKKNNPEADDKSEFQYTISLQNDKDVFEGNHVPWYGINDLYYHDEENPNDYYQVYYDEHDALWIETEGNQTYAAEFLGRYDSETNEYITRKTVDGVTTVYEFDTDIDNQKVSYTVGEDTFTVVLDGNRLQEATDHKSASITLTIPQTETINIANVPAGTTYTVTEGMNPGYQLIGIHSEVKADLEETIPVEQSTDIPTEGSTDEQAAAQLANLEITGTIVANKHNIITYTNKTVGTPLELLKIGESYNTKLEGVKFELYRDKKDEDGNYVTEDGKRVEEKVLVDVHNRPIGGSADGVITTGADGSVVIGTLAPDTTYRLREIKTADGYNMLTGDITLIVDNNADRTVHYTQENYTLSTTAGPEVKYVHNEEVSDGDENLEPGETTEQDGDLIEVVEYYSGHKAKPDTDESFFTEGVENYELIGYRLVIKNWTGYELPSTGGPGTAAFLISGLTLAITSGAVLTSRCSRRKKD